MDVKVIGVDIAKRYFQVHGIASSGEVTIRRKLPRNRFLELFAGLPPCLVGLEAGSGAHHWARQLARLGHRLMRPQFVRPYVKTNNTTPRMRRSGPGPARPTWPVRACRASEADRRGWVHDRAQPRPFKSEILSYFPQGN